MLGISLGAAGFGAAKAQDAYVNRRQGIDEGKCRIALKYGMWKLAGKKRG